MRSVRHTFVHPTRDELNYLNEKDERWENRGEHNQCGLWNICHPKVISSYSYSDTKHTTSMNCIHLYWHRTDLFGDEPRQVMDTAVRANGKTNRWSLVCKMRTCHQVYLTRIQRQSRAGGPQSKARRLDSQLLSSKSICPQARHKDTLQLQIHLEERHKSANIT